jgi:hypothetical protein
MVKYICIFLFIPILFLAQTNKKIKTLFLGNSYTYVNTLPELIRNLALVNGDTLKYDSNTPGGYTFNNHFNDIQSTSKIASDNWDYVVLQAQSQEPSFSPAQVNNQTLPYAIKLDSLIEANDYCTNTVFFETWGRKNGDASNCAVYPPVCTYTGMQNRLRQSYKLFADTCKAVMSPVGEAFRLSIQLNPSLELYQPDQSHPSLEGSYLAACVFYEVLFQKSVYPNQYFSTLNVSTANFLQQMAHKVVGDSLKVWNLGYNLPWAGFTYNPLGGFNYLFTSYSPFLNNTWHFGDGSTSNNALTLHTYSASGTYTVSHVVTDFCKTDSVTQVINITATGLNTKVNNNKFVMYPNPANEYLSLKGRDEIESENFKIEIRNTMGQLLYNEKYSEIISIKQLKNGIYFLKVFNSEESYNLQFIKNEN